MKSPKKQGPTQQETALADVSSQQWNDYVERFRPAEAALIDQAQLTEGERAQVKGEVSADTAAAFKGLPRTTIAANRGDASSGKAKLGLAGDADAAARARGIGSAAAETGAEQDSANQKLRIAGFGRQIATDVTADMHSGARRATRLALAESSARYANRRAELDAGSAIAGAATRRFGGDILTAMTPVEEIDTPILERRPVGQRRTI